jgi:cysteinyl-tRNA synthetase
MHEWRDHGLLGRALGIFGLESLESPDDAPEDVVALAMQRMLVRAMGDFDEADRLRDEIAEAGWDVRDEADTFRLVRRR